MQATFVSNTASRGGALGVVRSQAELYGPTTFMYNIAVDDDGGGVSAYMSTVTIGGPLCAQSNSAGTTTEAMGAFAGLRDGAMLVFQDPDTANLADNRPNDIQATGTGNFTAQGFGTLPAGQAFNITGSLGACAAAFVANTTTTCDACGAGGRWDARTCSCGRVRVLLL